jgi:hypothetical protein
MTNSFKFLALGLFVLAFGCKEQPPFIDYNPPIVLAKDTCYMATNIPQKQDKRVVVEDISGVRCVNCPQAATAAHNIKDNNPDRVTILTLHSNGFSAFTHPYSDTFNTLEATLIIEQLTIGTIAGLPIGAVQRKIFPGKSGTVTPYGTWAGYAASELLLKADVNVELDVITDKPNRKVTANVKSSFTSANDTAVYLTLILTESHIISEQDSKDSLITRYEHNFILRKTITPYNGILISDKAIMGQVCEKGFEFEIPKKYNYDNCSVVALVHRREIGKNIEILQSAEVEL